MTKGESNAPRDTTSRWGASSFHALPFALIRP